MSAITLRGHLLADARSYTQADGTAWITLRILSADQTALARWRIGQGYAAQYAAEQGARALGVGTAVTVHAAAWDIDAAGELRLYGIDSVEQRVTVWVTRQIEHTEPVLPEQRRSRPATAGIPRMEIA